MAADEALRRFWASTDGDTLYREARAEVDALVGAAPFGVAFLDRGMRFVRVNRVLARLDGWPPEDHVGRHIREVLGDESVRFESHLARVLETGRPVINDEFRVDPDAPGVEPGYYSATYYPTVDDAGRVLGVGVMLAEVTEARKAQHDLVLAKEAAEAAGARTVRILESITDAFFVLDRDWRFDYLNHQAERLLRRPREGLIGRVIWDEFPDALGTDFERYYLEAVATGRSAAFEAFFVPLSAWFEVRAFPSADGLSVYFRDVSGRREVEQAVRRSEERFRSLVKAASAIVWTTPASGVFETEQADWTEFTGQGFEDLKGWGWLDAFHPDDRPATRRAWQDALETHAPYQVEHRLRRRDGEYRHMAARAVPILAEGGGVREWVGVHTDVTETRRADEAKRRAEERFRLLVQNSSDVLTMFDAEGTILYESPSVERVLGIKTEDRVGHN
ncbi:MAG: PAS domain-containing protein, partial [Planctomycetia bacterium]|nr:PAS domain-containing protein [Planctomycetia bacterium]